MNATSDREGCTEVHYIWSLLVHKQVLHIEKNG